MRCKRKKEKHEKDFQQLKGIHAIILKLFATPFCLKIVICGSLPTKSKCLQSVSKRSKNILIFTCVKGPEGPSAPRDMQGYIEFRVRDGHQS